MHAAITLNTCLHKEVDQAVVKVLAAKVGVASCCLDLQHVAGKDNTHGGGTGQVLSSLLTTTVRDKHGTTVWPTNLEDALLNCQQGHIKGATAQVKNKYILFATGGACRNTATRASGRAKMCT